MDRLKSLWPWGIIIISIGVGLGLSGYQLVQHVRALASASELSRYQKFPALKSTDRITIVSPHLDDETLGLGGFVAQARQQGIPVSVIFMTNGDDFSFGADLELGTGYPTPQKLLAYGAKRQDEALAATAKLGIDPKDVYFLGLPDRGLKVLLDKKDGTSLVTSSGTLENHSPYARSYVPNLPYSRNALEAALAKAVNATSPTEVFTTLPDDVHTDHASTAQFVMQISSKLSSAPKLYFFLIHYPKFPNPKGSDSSYPLLPPDKLKDRQWQVISLSAEDVDLKTSALELYASQLMVPFSGKGLRAFVRQNELVLPK